jgi:hypothetical protein
MKKFADLTETDEGGLPVLMAAWHDLWDHDDARRPGSRAAVTPPFGLRSLPP